uniref:Protein kinase domain-containing protein n=1 Tax=Arcella intermedia TaxID=1963864 RepID=A0A6B2LH29_9EUKA
MERLDGDLVNLLQRRAAKRLDEREARGVFKMAVDIVAFLHSEGIVHRDLKLENFLVEWEGEGRAGVKDLKLTDFDSSDYTLREPFEYSCGSPPYSAPELCTTNPHFSGRIADIWSLGVMLYVLVCGTFPWHHPSLLTLFDMIRTRDLDLPPHLSPDLQHLLQNILQKAPSKRFTLQQILNHDWMVKYQS